MKIGHGPDFVLEVLERLTRNGFVVETHLPREGYGVATPTIVVDRTSYPGVEAHMVTIADIAGWRASLDEHGDVVISACRTTNDTGSTDIRPYREACARLISAVEGLVPHLARCRQELEEGHFPTLIWGQSTREYFRLDREAPPHEPPDVNSFIDRVDVSIRPHIVELNQLGFITLECCSGLPGDHPDREPWHSYVMFDEMTHENAAPHVFTLGDMAGWTVLRGRYNFDIEMRVRGDDDIKPAWERLVGEARVLAQMLAPRYGWYLRSSTSWLQKAMVAPGSEQTPAPQYADLESRPTNYCQPSSGTV
ncbi:MAG: hypothetical protein QXS20_07035 [Candidatus Thorarchaeota archaeon]